MARLLLILRNVCVELSFCLVFIVTISFFIFNLDIKLRVQKVLRRYLRKGGMLRGYNYYSRALLLSKLFVVISVFFITCTCYDTILASVISKDPIMHNLYATILIIFPSVTYILLWNYYRSIFLIRLPNIAFWNRVELIAYALYFWGILLFLLHVHNTRQSIVLSFDKITIAHDSQYLFQTPGTPVMEGIINLHHDIVFILIVVICLVMWLLIAVVFYFKSDAYYTYRLLSKNYAAISGFLFRTFFHECYGHGLDVIAAKGFASGYPYPTNVIELRRYTLPKLFQAFFVEHQNIIYSSRSPRLYRRWYHGPSLEIFWTVIPALVLISIALPSFALLYGMDDVGDPVLTLKAVGNQWYRSYEYADTPIVLNKYISVAELTCDVNSLGSIVYTVDSKKYTMGITDVNKYRSLWNSSLWALLLGVHFNDLLHRDRVLHTDLISEYARCKLQFPDVKSIFGSYFQESMRAVTDTFYNHLPEIMNLNRHVCRFSTSMLLELVNWSRTNSDNLQNIFARSIHYLGTKDSNLGNANIEGRLEPFWSFDYVEGLYDNIESFAGNVLSNDEYSAVNSYWSNRDYLGYVDGLIISHLLQLPSDVYLDLLGARQARTETMDNVMNFCATVMCYVDPQHALLWTEIVKRIFARAMFSVYLLDTWLVNKGVLSSMPVWSSDMILLIKSYLHSCRISYLKDFLLFTHSNVLLADLTDVNTNICLHSDKNLLQNISDNTSPISISFDSYMLSEDDLINSKNLFRLLSVDNTVYLPIKTHLRIVVSANDVSHSWAVPSLGIKLDACPGRLNQTGLYLKRSGDYYGQCSEICGVHHGFMPIHVRGVSLREYILYLNRKYIDTMDGFNADFLHLYTYLQISKKW